MSRFLLDTMAAVAVMRGTGSPIVMRELRAAVSIFVSAATPFEVLNKARSGKWPEMHIRYGGKPEKLVEDIERMGATFLDLTADIMAEAAAMRWDHRDPFDRMIVATARFHGLTIVTSDAAITEFTQATLW